MEDNEKNQEDNWKSELEWLFKFEKNSLQKPFCGRDII